MKMISRGEESKDKSKFMNCSKALIGDAKKV